MDLSLKNLRQTQFPTNRIVLNKNILFQVFGYLILLALAEFLSAVAESVVYGLVLHGLVLIGLLLQGALSGRRVTQRFCISLALVPLIRLMSLSLPLSDYQFMFWYMIIGAPLFIAAFVAARVMGFSLDRLLFNKNNFGLQILVGVSGLGLGFLEFLILKPEPLVSNFSFKEIWLPALILLIFTGLLEEVIFRALLQQTAREVLGRWGITFSAVLFAVMHIGYLSLLDFLFVLLVALYFGWVVYRTGSIVGVTLAHGLTNISLFLIFPFILIQNPITLPANTTLAQEQVLLVDPTSTPTFSAIESPTAVSKPEHTKIPVQTDGNIPMFEVTPTVYSTTPPQSSSTLQQIYTVDDGDEGFIRKGGTWWLVEEGYEGDLIWAIPVNDVPDTLIEWIPPINACGIYDVQVYIPEGYATYQQALYQIGYHDGVKTIMLDQSANAGKWVSLGEYQFSPHGEMVLRLSNWAKDVWQANEFVVFDAARWVFVGQCKH